jgi:protein tyrosine/serine phosphatase
MEVLVKATLKVFGLRHIGHDGASMNKWRELRFCGLAIAKGRVPGVERLLLCVVALLIAGCVYFSRRTLPGACAQDLGSPIRNFCVVTPGVLWRAEAPTRSDAQWLVEHGIGTVVSLQLNVRRSFESVHLDPAQARSVVYYRVRDFSAIQVLTHQHLDEHVAEVLAIIEKAPKPVIISCRAGVDRTGVIAAAYRMLVQGWSAQRAVADMDGFHSPWDPLNNRYVRSITGARKERILRSVDQWRARLQPTGRFECRGRGCRFVPH